jgi:hypothetical protein
MALRHRRGVHGQGPKDGARIALRVAGLCSFARSCDDRLDKTARNSDPPLAAEHLDQDDLALCRAHTAVQRAEARQTSASNFDPLARRIPAFGRWRRSLESHHAIFIAARPKRLNVTVLDTGWRVVKLDEVRDSRRSLDSSPLSLDQNEQVIAEQQDRLFAKRDTDLWRKEHEARLSDREHCKLVALGFGADDGPVRHLHSSGPQRAEKMPAVATVFNPR